MELIYRPDCIQIWIAILNESYIPIREILCEFFILGRCKHQHALITDFTILIVIIPHHSPYYHIMIRGIDKIIVTRFRSM